jgi:hypothetical protein
MNYNPEKEPIKVSWKFFVAWKQILKIPFIFQAFLRIRPKPENYQSIEEPYIEIIDDVEVSMTPPEVNMTASRTCLATVPSIATIFCA